jgi:hypothetical protein
MVRMVEIERVMGEIAGHFRHLVIKCQVCTLYGDVRWDGRAEMGNKVRWKQGGAWMAQTSGGLLGIHHIWEDPIGLGSYKWNVRRPVNSGILGVAAQHGWPIANQ